MIACCGITAVERHNRSMARPYTFYSNCRVDRCHRFRWIHAAMDTRMPA